MSTNGSQTLASRFLFSTSPRFDYGFRGGRTQPTQPSAHIVPMFFREREKPIMDIKQLTEEMHRLVESKGWYARDSKRPQTPRNLAVSLSIEAAEILEQFQFTDEIKDKDEL